MLDAVDEALKLIASRHDATRANILIIGETRDRGSEGKLSDLIPKVQRAGVTIYSLTYSAYLTPFTIRPEEYEATSGGLLQGLTETARLAKRNTVEALTAATGGRRFGFETKSKLENDLIRRGNSQPLLALIHARSRTKFPFSPVATAD